MPPRQQATASGARDERQALRCQYLVEEPPAPQATSDGGRRRKARRLPRLWEPPVPQATRRSLAPQVTKPGEPQQDGPLFPRCKTVPCSPGNKTVPCSPGNKTVPCSPGNKTVPRSPGNKTVPCSPANKTVRCSPGNTAWGTACAALQRSLPPAAAAAPRARERLLVEGLRPRRPVQGCPEGAAGRSRIRVHPSMETRSRKNPPPPVKKWGGCDD